MLVSSEETADVSTGPETADMHTTPKFISDDGNCFICIYWPNWYLHCCTGPPDGFFTVEFVEMVISKYSSLASFRSGMNQTTIVSSRLDDVGRMNEVEESLLEKPDYRIFSENPLQLGFCLDCIGNGKSIII